MSKLTSHEVRLASRPAGIPAATNFTLVRTELEPLQDREVLVRSLFMSVDPYARPHERGANRTCRHLSWANRWRRSG